MPPAAGERLDEHIAGICSSSGPIQRHDLRLTRHLHCRFNGYTAECTIKHRARWNVDEETIIRTRRTIKGPHRFKSRSQSRQRPQRTPSCPLSFHPNEYTSPSSIRKKRKFRIADIKARSSNTVPVQHNVCHAPAAASSTRTGASASTRRGAVKSTEMRSP